MKWINKLFNKKEHIVKHNVSVSSSIIYGNPALPVEDQKNTTNINSINIDNFMQTVSVTTQKGLRVQVVNMSMENAQDIGFINVDALKNYC